MILSEFKKSNTQDLVPYGMIFVYINLVIFVSDGQMIETRHNMNVADSNHLTSFGTGMFVMPNTIDFNYVFVNMGFEDNLTIYLTLIISLTIFVCLLIWARFKDRKDVQRVSDCLFQITFL